MEWRNWLDSEKWPEFEQKKFKKSCRGSVWIMFLMVEMDSTPSITSRAPKIMNLDNFYLDLEKSMPDFFKIWPEFP